MAISKASARIHHSRRLLFLAIELELILAIRLEHIARARPSSY